MFIGALSFHEETASWNGKFHLSPNVHIFTIERINTHYRRWPPFLHGPHGRKTACNNKFKRNFIQKKSWFMII